MRTLHLRALLPATCSGEGTTETALEKRSPTVELNSNFMFNYVVVPSRGGLAYGDTGDFPGGPAGRRAGP